MEHGTLWGRSNMWEGGEVKDVQALRDERGIDLQRVGVKDVFICHI